MAMVNSIPLDVGEPLVGVSFVATGGTGVVTLATTVGALPAGLTLNASTGALTGTPTTGGAWSASVTATDSSTPTPATVTEAFAGTVTQTASEDEDMPKIAPEIFYASGTWTKPTTAPGNTATWAKVEIWNAGGNNGAPGSDKAEYWLDFASLGATVAVTVGQTSAAASSFDTFTTANAISNGAKFFAGHSPVVGMFNDSNGLTAFNGGRAGGSDGGGGGYGYIAVAGGAGSRPGGGGGQGSTAGAGAPGMIVVTLI